MSIYDYLRAWIEAHPGAWKEGPFTVNRTAWDKRTYFNIYSKGERRWGYQFVVPRDDSSGVKGSYMAQLLNEWVSDHKEEDECQQ